MSIRKMMKPSRPYDRTEAAINELDPADREEIIDVIINDYGYTGTDIAEYLNAQTNHRHKVDRLSVGSHRQKLRQRQEEQ